MTFHVVGGGSIFQERHLVVTVFVGNESFQTRFHVFVEALQQSQRKGVLDGCQFIFVVDALIFIASLVIQVVIRVGIVVRGRSVSLIDTVVVVDVQCVDKTGDGHIFTLHILVQAVLLMLHGQHAVERFGRVNLDTRCVRRLLVGYGFSDRFVAHNFRISGTPCRSLV